MREIFCENCNAPLTEVSESEILISIQERIILLKYFCGVSCIHSWSGTLLCVSAKIEGKKNEQFNEN